jgi:Putative Actinobacterial Holin-X, holin superfamily III
MPQQNGNALRDESTGQLVKQLSGEVSTLVHQEMDLAKALLREEIGRARETLARDVELAKEELSEKGKHAGMGAGMFGGAAVAAVLALGTLTAFLILALDGVMDNWLAALIIGLVWAAVAAFLALRGRAELRKMGSPVPERAIDQIKTDAGNLASGLKNDAETSAESIKEDVQWAKTRK